MLVHIERKHNGLAHPIDNYKLNNSRSVPIDQPYIQKQNPPLSYYVRNLRRFLAIPDSNNSTWSHQFSNSDNDPISRGLEFMDRVGQLSKGFHDSSLSKFLRPVYYSRLADSSTYHQIQNTYNNPTSTTRSLINRFSLSPGPANAYKYKDVTFIYADICPVCLEMYSIPVYLDNGISNDELAKK
jgi:hypothetical protein